jgi:hypothetical protein
MVVVRVEPIAPARTKGTSKVAAAPYKRQQSQNSSDMALRVMLPATTNKQQLLYYLVLFEYFYSAYSHIIIE